MQRVIWIKWSIAIWNMVLTSSASLWNISEHEQFCAPIQRKQEYSFLSLVLQQTEQELIGYKDNSSDRLRICENVRFETILLYQNHANNIFIDRNPCMRNDFKSHWYVSSAQSLLLDLLNQMVNSIQGSLLSQFYIDMRGFARMTLQYS